MIPCGGNPLETIGMFVTGEEKAMTTVERVRQAVRDSGDGSVPGDDEPLFDDGQLSLDRLEVALRIEEEFSIEIPDSATTGPGFCTVAGIAAWVDANRVATPSSGVRTG